MKPFSFDPLEAAVFACGLLLALMLVRTLKARQSAKSGRPITVGKSWMPAALALILLVVLWFYLS
jgi:hypothetical protein